MKLLFCSCRYCKTGRKSRRNRFQINYLKRAYRHKVKQQLRQGEYEDLPEKIPVGFTD